MHISAFSIFTLSIMQHYRKHSINCHLFYKQRNAVIIIMNGLNDFLICITKHAMFFFLQITNVLDNGLWHYKCHTVHNQVEGYCSYVNVFFSFKQVKCKNLFILLGCTWQKFLLMRMQIAHSPRPYQVNSDTRCYFPTKRAQTVKAVKPRPHKFL